MTIKNEVLNEETTKKDVKATSKENVKEVKNEDLSNAVNISVGVVPQDEEKEIEIPANSLKYIDPVTLLQIDVIRTLFSKNRAGIKLELLIKSTSGFVFKPYIILKPEFVDLLNHKNGNFLAKMKDDEIISNRQAAIKFLKWTKEFFIEETGELKTFKKYGAIIHMAGKKIPIFFSNEHCEIITELLADDKLKLDLYDTKKEELRKLGYVEGDLESELL